MFSGIIRLILIFSFMLNISNISCKKTSTSPNLDELTNPVIWTNVSEVTFNATEAGANPDSQTLQVKNSGEDTLNYSISCDINCISISPTSSSSTGNVNEHTVSTDISGLSEGNYSGIITISDSNAANSPLTVSVSLEIISPLTDNEISISCHPSSGGTGTIVTIPVTIRGNTQEINAFGLDLTYDTTMFDYQAVIAGDLTGDWSIVDGNEVISGTVRIGGFAGSGDSIAQGGMGSIVEVTLIVTCGGCNDDQQSQICIQNYSDGVAGMTLEPTCATFTYKE